MRLVFLHLLFCCSFAAFAQDAEVKPGEAIRYKYRVSDGVIGKRKMLRHLDTIVPAVFPELKNSRTCGGNKCAEDYYVELVYSLKVADRTFYPKVAGKSSKTTEYEHITTYKIQAYFLLKNKEEQTVSYWSLFDADAQYEHKTKHTLQNASGEIEKKVITTIDPSTTRYDYQVVLAPVDNPNSLPGNTDPISYFKNYGLTDPQQKDLEKNIVDRLYEFRIIKVKKEETTI